MSTYYDFMVEAKYEGKWYNIDFTQLYWLAGGSGERSMGHWL